MVKCQKCDEENSGNAKFCNSCGVENMRNIIIRFVISIFLFICMLGFVFAVTPQSFIDEIGSGQSNIYTLEGKEYIVAYEKTYNDGDVFIVNGESTLICHTSDQKFLGMKVRVCDDLNTGEKRVFSDGSSLTFLGQRTENGKQLLLYFGNFKLQAPETKIPTCSAGWTCEDPFYRIYISSDCFKSNKEYCKYGCANGVCLIQTCSAGWKCKDNDNRAYQNPCIFL